MNRKDALKHIQDVPEWDVVVIGGGATGMGAAVDAAARGFKTLLLEQDDFAKATSSRSTKLSHGGVRYLEQGNISLVYGALHERGRMIRNAPHLVHPLKFVIPAYRWWELPFYGIGLMVYDLLAGKLTLGRSRILSRAKTIEMLPTVKTEGLRGGVLYTDGQFDDARMVVTLARTLIDLGGTALNYMRVSGLIKEEGKVAGVTAKDVESGTEFKIKARGVLNATGIFSDTMRKSDDPGVKPMLSVSQGTHIVLDRSFLPGDSALMIPKTEDGRVLFAVPWHSHVLVGTTDMPMDQPLLEPRALAEEKEFLLHHTRKYLSKPLEERDILSIFSGLRPLVKHGDTKNTAALSRDHTVEVSPSNLVTITGGKWTTYRHMGEDAVDHLIKAAGLEPRESRTKELHLHGWMEPGPDDHANMYGTDYPELTKLADADPQLKKLLHPRLAYQEVEVVWAVRHDMARTVEDVLARRTRALLLDTRASIEAAPRVAEILAAELGKDAQWQKEEVTRYEQLAKGYIYSD